MPKTAFPAAFYAPLKDGDPWSVMFPDVPGCISAGDTLEQALCNATEGLEAHLDLMAADGDELPLPSDLASARARIDAEAEPGDGPPDAMLLVPVLLPGRVARLNISMDEALVAQIDAVAANRSAFLADAARAELKRRRALG